MKKQLRFVVLLVFVLLCQNLRAQEIVDFYDSVYFETNVSHVFIDTNSVSNCWQIGHPSKLIFDSAYSAPLAIVTDTVNPYPVNSFSTFEVKMHYDQTWCMGELRFMHKYDFEPFVDGGYVEVKYLHDSTWTNIIYDTVPMHGCYGSNFYTINNILLDGTPAFTGSSNGWTESSFNWIWAAPMKNWNEYDTLWIRFVMRSDSNQSNHEGWMIDNIHLTLYCGTGIHGHDSPEIQSFVYPNPISEHAVIRYSNQGREECEICIFDAYGRLIERFVSLEETVSPDYSKYRPGIYFYSITNHKGEKSSGRFLRQ